jgi:hypothetical protein
MDRTNFLHAHDSGRDPIPDAIADSLWLGGEAMVSPACVREMNIARADATECDADPSWLVI